MSWLSDRALNLVLVAAYLAILARHAWVGRRHTRSISDYLVAGRRMGGTVIALSFYATFMSTNTFIGAAGKSWSEGLAWCTGGIVLVGLACAAWLVVAPRFTPLTREYGSLTVPDFVGSHYRSRRARQLAAVIVAFSSVLYLVAIYRGAALALASYLGGSYFWCVVTVLVVVTTYTLLGGFESVVLTDALQGSLMVAGAVAMAVALAHAGGGLSAIFAKLAAEDPRLVSWTDRAALSATLAYSLAVGVKYLVEPRQLSRFYGLKDRRALRQAAVVAPLAILVTYVCLLPLGAMARAVLPAGAVADTDQVVPFLLGETGILGPWMSTVFLLVLISAAMSSIDSVLLVAASAIDRDLIPSAPSPADDAPAAVRRARVWVVVVAVVSAAAALTPPARDIVRMTAFSGSLYGACFLPVLVVGLFVRRRSAAAANWTMSLGGLTVIGAFVLRELGITKVHEVYPGILTGLAVYALASIFARLNSRPRCSSS